MSKLNSVRLLQQIPQQHLCKSNMVAILFDHCGTLRTNMLIEQEISWRIRMELTTW